MAATVTPKQARALARAGWRFACATKTTTTTKTKGRDDH
jgi:hypothetical protein